MKRAVVLFFILTLLVASSVTAQEAVTLKTLKGHQGSFVTLDGIAPSTAATVRTRISVGSEGSEGLQGVWLAGFSDRPDAPPTLLSLTWSEVTSGWFPVWGLQLQSSAGLLPESLKTAQGAGFLEGSTYTSLQTSSLEPGHVVEARLSYDPVSGVASIGVLDLTNNTRIYSNVIILKPYSGKLYPVFGLVGEKYGLQVEQATVSPYAVPVGAAWDILVKEPSGYDQIMTTRLTQANDMAMRLESYPQAVKGKYVLVVDNGSKTQQLVELSGNARAEAAILPFPITRLPLGEVALRLNYLDENGYTWDLGARSIEVVAANLNIDFKKLEIGTDALNGTVLVTSQDESLQQPVLRIFATETKPGRSAGERRLVFEQRLERITTVQQSIAFSIPVVSGASLFGLNIDVELDVPVGKLITGNQYSVMWLQ